MRRLALIIIDGFGVAPPGPGNARSLAKMPTLDRLEKEVPNVLMDAAGNAVGLPQGQQGSSEPGHLTIGAGRVVWQLQERIDRDIRSEEFAKNNVLREACERAKKNKSALHLIGLYSTGGVHSSAEHYHAVLRLAKEIGVPNVVLHLFSDGRDTPEQYFCTDFDLLKKEIDAVHLGTIASVVGRYFAMDRDRRYAERTKPAYDLLTAGEGELVEDPCDGVKAWYAKGPAGIKTDQYVRPLKTAAFESIKAGDTVICINFRADRMIQIVTALEAEDFKEFPRPVRVKGVVCMGPYSDHLPVAYPKLPVSNTLGEIVSNAGLKQLRMTETDKFTHITFFFNAQRPDPFPGEDRIMMESPNVATFADAPEMKSKELTDMMIEKAKTGEYALMVVNYPNPDLTGHGGQIPAVVKACETVDKYLGILLPQLEALGYDWIITSDHGNAEEMYYPGTNTICPSHTVNQVQTFVHTESIRSSADLQQYTSLTGIAPLALKILGLPIPKEMA